MKDEAQIAKRYFGSFAADYHRAFEGTGQQPLHALINSLFRRKTFQRRTDVVRAWLQEDAVSGKHVLELGCGSGEVSIEPADIVMMIGVIEYYRDLDDLIPRVAAAARESLIIVDTRGPWWRRTLRYALARVKHFHLYYHAPDRVAAVAARAGLAERARVAGHSYTAFWFRRPSAER
jgi:SAM-dependent methyltransferase